MYFNSFDWFDSFSLLLYRLLIQPDKTTSQQIHLGGRPIVNPTDGSYLHHHHHHHSIIPSCTPSRPNPPANQSVSRRLPALPPVCTAMQIGMEICVSSPLGWRGNKSTPTCLLTSYTLREPASVYSCHVLIRWNRYV